MQFFSNCTPWIVRGRAPDRERTVATRILIVDDSPTVRRVERALIERQRDWEVCGEAENGQVAIEKFGELRPDCVVLDMSMPVMNGLEAARKLSSIAPQVPLLMCTMFKSTQLLREARKAGIYDVISKSEELSEGLVKAIDTALQDAAN